MSEKKITKLKLSLSLEQWLLLYMILEIFSDHSKKDYKEKVESLRDEVQKLINRYIESLNVNV